MADVFIDATYLEVGDLAGVAPAGDNVGTLVAGADDVGIIVPQEPVGWDPDLGSVHTPGRPLKGRYLLLRVTENGDTTDATVTVLPGVQGGTPANLATLGELGPSTTFANNEVRYIQVELARHLQADGTVHVAVGGGATASVQLAAFVLDKAS